MNKKIWAILLVLALIAGIATAETHLWFVDNCPTIVKQTEKNFSNISNLAVFCKIAYVHSIP